MTKDRYYLVEEKVGNPNILNPNPYIYIEQESEREREAACVKATNQPPFQ